MNRPSSLDRTIRKTPKIPLKLNITAAFSSLFMLSMLFVIVYTYYSNSRHILSISDELFQKTSDMVVEETINFLEPAANVVKLTSSIFQSGILYQGKSPLDLKAISPYHPDRLTHLELYFLGILREHPQLEFVTVGNETGYYLWVERKSKGFYRILHLDRTVDPFTCREKTVDYYSTIVGEKDCASEFRNYDHRKRVWYMDAKKSGGFNLTDMYLFFTETSQPGITASQTVTERNGRFLGVMTADMNLSIISEYLKKFRLGRQGKIFIINSRDEVIASQDGIEKIIRKDAGVSRSVKIGELGCPWIAESLKFHKIHGTRKVVHPYKGKNFITSFVDFPDHFGKSWKIVLSASEDDFTLGIMKTNNLCLMFSFFVILISLLLISGISSSISRPVSAVAESIKKISHFECGENLRFESGLREINLLVESFHDLKTGMIEFQKFVPRSVVKNLLHVGKTAEIGGEIAELTIFFSDVQDFTNISEKMPCDKLMSHFSQYLDEVTSLILEHDGTLDKYIGDAVLAFWGAPHENPGHAYCACKAAVMCQRMLDRLNQEWAANGLPELHTRIGLYTGTAIVGNVGSSFRVNYSVLGESSYFPQRLESVNKSYGTRIMITDETYSQVREDFVTRPLDRVCIGAKGKTFTLYEVMELKGHSDDLELLAESFTNAFQLYHARNWAAADEIIQDLIRKWPHDSVLELYARRLSTVRNMEDPDQWNTQINGLRAKDILHQETGNEHVIQP